MTETFVAIDFDLEALQRQFPPKPKPLISFPNGLTCQKIYEKIDPSVQWVFTTMCLEIVELRKRI
jgi:hypothetical protein